MKSLANVYEFTVMRWMAWVSLLIKLGLHENTQTEYKYWFPFGKLLKQVTKLWNLNVWNADMTLMEE